MLGVRMGLSYFLLRIHDLTPYNRAIVQVRFLTENPKYRRSVEWAGSVTHRSR